MLNLFEIKKSKAPIFINNINITKAYRRKVEPILAKLDLANYYRIENAQAKIDFEKWKKVKELAVKGKSESFIEALNYEIAESGTTSDFHIHTSKPNYAIEYTKDDNGHFNMWVDQSCGYLGDDYSGTVTIELEKDKKYLSFEYVC